MSNNKLPVGIIAEVNALLDIVSDSGSEAILCKHWSDGSSGTGIVDMEELVPVPIWKSCGLVSCKHTTSEASPDDGGGPAGSARSGWPELQK